MMRSIILLVLIKLKQEQQHPQYTPEIVHDDDDTKTITTKQLLVQPPPKHNLYIQSTIYTIQQSYTFLPPSSKLFQFFFSRSFVIVQKYHKSKKKFKDSSTHTVSNTCLLAFRYISFISPYTYRN